MINRTPKNILCLSTYRYDTFLNCVKTPSHLLDKEIIAKMPNNKSDYVIVPARIAQMVERTQV